MNSFDPEEIVAEYENEIVWASALYYEGDQVVQSPLTDAEYDARVAFVCANWSYTSEEFRERGTRDELAASGSHLVQEGDHEDAVAWVNDKWGQN